MSNPPAALEGFTIIGGNANGDSFDGRRGGGMYSENGSPTVTNCTFTGNQGIFGGGMCNYKSYPLLVNCMFTINTADHGGGMRNMSESSPLITNCIFTGNHAFSRGGGISNQGECNPTVTNCKIISKAKGLQEIKPGQITFCVMARSDTNEPNRLISSAVGLAVPKDREHYGYISEHHSCGETARKAGDYAEDLAATMLATTLGISFDPDEAWDSRKQVYKASKYIFKSTNICQSAEGDKYGKWTTVIAAVVMLF